MLFGGPCRRLRHRRALRRADGWRCWSRRLTICDEWAVVIRWCLEAKGWVAVRLEGLIAFSSANQRYITDILHAANFADATFADVYEPSFMVLTWPWLLTGDR